MAGTTTTTRKLVIEIEKARTEIADLKARVMELERKADYSPPWYQTDFPGAGPNT